VIGPLPGAGDGHEGGAKAIAFVGQDRLIVAVESVGLVLFDRREKGTQVLVPGQQCIHALSRGRDFGFGHAARNELVRFTLDGVAPLAMPAHGASGEAAALDPTESLVATADRDGIVRVGPISVREPHLLLGHEGRAFDVVFSPDGGSLASFGQDGTLRLWTTPDPERTPFQSLPHDELLATLRRLTNLRAVADSASSSGWKLAYDPFPGWAKAPEW